MTDPIPEEPSPDIHDLMEEIALLVTKQLPKMTEVSLEAHLFPKGGRPIRMTLNMEPITMTKGIMEL